MKVEEIKTEMLNFRDFFGGDLINLEDVKKAKTKKELAEIIEAHRDFLESSLCDANSHLNNFKKKLGLTCL